MFVFFSATAAVPETEVSHSSSSFNQMHQEVEKHTIIPETQVVIVYSIYIYVCMYVHMYSNYCMYVNDNVMCAQAQVEPRMEQLFDFPVTSYCL